jgi:hypothetical protein
MTGRADGFIENEDGSFTAPAVPILSESQVEYWTEVFEFDLFSKVHEERRSFNEFLEDEVGNWTITMNEFISETNHNLKRPSIIFAPPEMTARWKKENDDYSEKWKALVKKLEYQYERHLKKGEEMRDKWENMNFQCHEGEIITPLSSATHREEAGHEKIEINCALYQDLIREWKHHEEALKHLTEVYWIDPVLELQSKIIDLSDVVADFCDRHDKYE